MAELRVRQYLRDQMAAAILKALAAEFSYIDIAGYIGDGANRYDDEEWELMARLAAEAACEVFEAVPDMSLNPSLAYPPRTYRLPG